MSERMVEVIGWKDPIGEGLYNMGVTDERIVRCRDCERWRDEPPNYREEPQWCGRFACHAEPEGFCKWGEPRETPKLLPCPFCGGDAKLDVENEGWSVWHACDGLKGIAKDYHSLDVPEFRTPWYKDRQTAVSAWNSRCAK